ncbi:PLP-dependent transferase [Metschnikowia bicuspidata]|uniref:aromatic-amino-acid transaminase n=1 Tax=Metschnikowia bicuspidata TaxID=27322 RepID=A0A4P9Z9K5_9ASCO|nr:PLP-dependent transferase [Metschnikowia bicuspidata]
MTAAKDLSHHLSVEARSRKNSPLKSAFRFYNNPEITFLGGGLPLADYFPFEKISAHCPTPPFANGIGAPVSDANNTLVEVHKRAAANDPVHFDVELARSLQYGYTEGHNELLAFLKEHTNTIHRVLYDDWDLIVSVGNTQSWDACLRTFVTRGDPILVEEFSFSSALETAHAQGVVTFPVPMDGEGIIPQALADVLDRWVGRKPKLLYTICTGQNPTGSCASAERRRVIYKLAQQHDFIIVEDEPYYFLQMEPYTRDLAEYKGKRLYTHDEFIKALVPSYLSLDVDGRVLRLDSVSKTIAPGSRLGWIVGQKNLLERFVRLQEVSIQCPSGFVQSVLNGLFQRWGQKGYLDWLIGLRAEYTHKRDVAIDALYAHFPLKVCRILPPVAGMFFIVQLDASKHPRYKELGEDPLKVEDAVYNRGLEYGCLMIPGSWFRADGQTNPPQEKLPEDEERKHTIFFRGTYAAVSLDDLQSGLEKFGRAVKAEFGL